MAGCSPSSVETFDIWIQKGTVVDGTGSAPYTADIFIRSDSIAFIGTPKFKFDAKQIIDATGKVVTPGFIDAHAHGDPLTSSMESFLRMGVTTVVLGQDGFHPSAENMGLLDWMDSLDRIGAQVNVVMFAGHATLRSEVGVVIGNQPRNDQLEEMSKLLIGYLKEGCYGLSTGLEYAPAINTQTEELEIFAKILGREGGLMMSHVRNEDEGYVIQSIKELLSLGRYCPVHLSHAKVVYGKGEQRAYEILSLLDSAREAGTRISVDVYPYIASYTTIGILFPKYSKTPESFEVAAKNRTQELRNYLFRRVRKRNGPEATLFAANKYAGKTLKEVADELDTSFVDVLMELGPSGGSGAYFIMEDTLMSTLLLNPNVMLSSDGSPTMRHPRGYGAFAKFIRVYFGERKELSLEEVIRKVTNLPAETLGLKDRGRIEIGLKADVLIFNPEDIKDNASYEDPFQFADGMEYVLVNGKLKIDEGNLLNSQNGRLLRKSTN